MRQLRTGQELDCLGGARNCPAVAEDLGIIHSRMTLLSHSGGHVTRFLERVPQFLHVMRAGNRNDRRPSESPDNRERVTSGGGDKHVLASFLDLQNRVRRIERRSEEHTSELQSLMRTSYAVFCLKTKKRIKRTHVR